jgi:hypothetical protein
LWQRIRFKVIPVARSIIMKRENLTEAQYLERVSLFFEKTKNDEKGIDQAWATSGP